MSEKASPSSSLVFIVLYIGLILVQLFLLVHKSLSLPQFVDSVNLPLFSFGFVSLEDLKSEGSSGSVVYIFLTFLNFSLTLLDVWRFKSNQMTTAHVTEIEVHRKADSRKYQFVSERSFDKGERESLVNSMSLHSDFEQTPAIFQDSPPSKQTLSKKQLNLSKIKSCKDLLKDPTNMRILVIVGCITSLNLLQFLSLIVSVTYQDGLPGLVLSLLFSLELIWIVGKSNTKNFLRRFYVICRLTTWTVLLLLLLIFVINCESLAPSFNRLGNWKIVKLLAEELFSDFDFDSKRILSLSLLLIFSCLSCHYFNLRLEPYLEDTRSLDFFDHVNLFENYTLSIIESYFLAVFKEVGANV